ncbi:histidine kinase-, DNA gyrase B-, and HSP90-like ATPase family protein [Orientia tsutsugamushi str. Gilliam]|uniref:histidine kinase n=1 Tax=Orientia tsutsugamushi str. Gilliam TaxID=1359184 RepID=A0A0F3M6D2_ORITS|nr:HAMP domain-containing sensor histidine kinase [Orientia tsutsugamushi]KJV51216.1 histidine kinase-, DNA gyrase B-, and HSP90-like ATPase family protein [Orientia tsutsugamushi str. Gilliam]KJV51265.1 histidine kinase-, DNA gyrase B-, and HSP90-like ATPase family protein [Orientia tsutsugamushi str. Gilliam]KJV51595.1 histidine kinase-, DNA gyrase B-, and HSP90-like ATPase family protein [Orientia tsutsugamushi str. Gilliam]KJV53635.1 histidine kinase-, DNA gyrase B-, and HSP90-like ATPase f
MKEKKKTINKWMVQIPPIPITLMNGESENIDEYMEIITKLRKAKYQVEVAESLKEYCTDLIQEIKYRFNIATSEIVRLASEIMLNDSENKDKLETILNRSANLQGYCNDVVYTLRSEIEKENLCSKKFSIQKLVKDAVRRLEYIAKEKDIKINYNFQYKMKDIVIGNIDHLQAILSQLIGSVIRFNHSCQVIITVHLFTVKNYIKSDNILQFRIHDTGSGISKEKLGNIKAKLAHFDLVRDYPLMLESGLWFVNYLVNQLNGEMEIESEKDKFTTITCNIPVQLF